jgi:hypothetical protein
MPFGGIKAETLTLPPTSTSRVCGLTAAAPPPAFRVRTRRGRTEEGAEVGEEGLQG